MGINIFGYKSKGEKNNRKIKEPRKRSKGRGG
jgi:hypothetical protein